MGINDYFKDVYCINLDRRTDRWKEAQEELEKHNVHATRFSGVDGNPDNIKAEGLEDIFRKGNIGCTLSHCNVVKKAKEDNLEMVLVLEDDVIFTENVNEKFDVYINELPADWGMIYFGGNHIGGLRHHSPHVSRINQTYTTHAYGIKNTMFDQVIGLHGDAQYQVDVCYAKLQRTNNCYVFRPHLAWQRDGFSDIQNKHTEYPFLK